MTTPSPLDLLHALLADSPELPLLADPECWKLVEAHAGEYGVAPLIAYVARSHVDGAKRAWCDQVLVQSWRRYERMLRKLEDLSTLLHGAGVETIALKGPLLARRHYTPPFIRKPSLDLDFAVRLQDLDRACEVLQREGYVLDLPLDYSRNHYHHVELSHPKLPHVELHFRLTHRALGILVDEFFDRAVTAELPGGSQTLVLSPADQLLHLALHLAQSRFGTVFHLYEMRRIWNSEPLTVRLEAISRGVEHHYAGVFRILDIAFAARWNERLLPPGISLPETWLNWRLTPKMHSTFEKWSMPGRGFGVFQRMWARWLDLQLSDRPSDALRMAAFFGRTALHDVTDWNAWRLVRPVRFAPSTPSLTSLPTKSPPRNQSFS